MLSLWIYPFIDPLGLQSFMLIFSLVLKSLAIITSFDLLSVRFGCFMKLGRFHFGRRDMHLFSRRDRLHFGRNGRLPFGRRGRMPFWQDGSLQPLHLLYHHCHQHFPYQLHRCLGWGLLSQFSLFCCFPHFPLLSKQTLAIEYHVYIWQVSPQLSYGDTCQISMWFRG